MTNIVNMASWLSWLERRPVTAEVEGSSPSGVVSSLYCGILAQLGEHLPYKQGVTGSSPVGPTQFNKVNNMGGFPSGQRGQTVNLLQIASVVRIHHRPSFLISRDGAVWKLAGLITRRSVVQIHLPQLRAQIAQLVEQRTENPRVVGSIPTLGTCFL